MPKSESESRSWHHRATGFSTVFTQKNQLSFRLLGNEEEKNRGFRLLKEKKSGSCGLVIHPSTGIWGYFRVIHSETFKK